MENKSNRNGWIIGGVIAFVAACATACFFIYHTMQERQRRERWRHYDDKYIDQK